jgi:hypothetical protein
MVALRVFHMAQSRARVQQDLGFIFFINPMQPVFEQILVSLGYYIKCHNTPKSFSQ